MDVLEKLSSEGAEEREEEEKTVQSTEAGKLLFVISSFPLICSALSREAGSETIPAVKYCFINGTWAIFPLSRSELGTVWVSREQMKPWKVLSADVEWAEAGAMFNSMIHYSGCFLRALLKVLRHYVYNDNTPVTAHNWNSSCKMSSIKVPIHLGCSHYHRQFILSPRSLFEVPWDETQFNCNHVGQKCSTETEKPGISTDTESRMGEMFVTCQAIIPTL